MPQKQFDIEQLKSLLRRNLKAAESYVPISIKLANDETCEDEWGAYYKGKADAFESTLTLIENIEK